MPDPFAHESTTLPQEAALAFAPLHKRHFGTAIGLALGLTISFFTLLDLLTNPPEARPLNLLGQYFYSYAVTWRGVWVGGLWGFFVGFVAGWFVAFCRNFVLATAIFWARAKANLRASRDFLDHI